MSDFIKNVFQKAVPQQFVRAYGAVKKYWQGHASGKEAAAEFVEEGAKDLAKVAVGCAAAAVPGGRFVAEVAVNGLDAVFNDTNIPKALVKGGLHAANLAIAGPMGAIPLNYAADCLVDKADEARKIGVHNALNNFKRHNEWKEFRRVKFADDIAEKELNASELGMSFIGMHRAKPKAA